MGEGSGSPEAQLTRTFSVSANRTVRAAVSSSCNLDCVYCPRFSSMEDFTPERFRGVRLESAEWLALLLQLSRVAGLEEVCLTGGEPFLNPGLCRIVAGLKEHGLRVELNTNGLAGSDQAFADVVAMVDRVKISLDSLNGPTVAYAMGIRSGERALDRVQQRISTAIALGTDTAVNAVVMKSTVDGVPALRDWVGNAGATLQLLDFYFNHERRSQWIEEFVDVTELDVGPLSREAGEAGCVYFNSGGDPSAPPIRMKTSTLGTYRDEQCVACSQYCQEGLYTLRFSSAGWLTVCPSELEEYGTLLEPGLSDERMAQQVRPLSSRLERLCLHEDSFSTMLSRNSLPLVEFGR